MCSDKIHQGGAVGAPIGGQVLSEVLPYLEIKKDNETEQDTRKEVEVPKIEGLTIKEAVKKLEEKGLGIDFGEKEIDIEKTIINTQIPKSGIKVYEGTNVIVSY